MSTNKDTFHAIVSNVVSAVAPLRYALSEVDNFNALLRTMGWDSNVTSVPTAYSDLVTDIEQLLDLLDNLPDPPSMSDKLNLLDAASQLYNSIKGAANSNVPGGIADTNGFTAEFAERLAEYLAIRYIAERLPKIYSLLKLFGAIVSVSYPEVIGTNARRAFTRTEFNFDNLKDFVNNPTELLKTMFKWGLTDFDFNPVMALIQGFFVAKGIPARIDPDTGEIGDSFGYTEESVIPNSRSVLNVPLYSFFLSNQFYEIGFQLLKYVRNQQPGLLLQPMFPNSVSQTLAITSDTNLVFTGTSNAATQFGVDVNPVDGITVKYPGALGTAFPELGFGASIKYEPEEPLHIFGNPLATRIELSGAEFGFEVNHLNDGFEIELQTLIKNLSVILAGGDGDNFISKILGNTEKRLDFEFGITWSNTGGLRFIGAGGFELQLNPHIQLGPIEIENLRLALQALPSSPAKVKLIAAAGLKLSLGPFTAVVQEIGVELALTFAEGNAGPFDIKAGFKPPTGIGLVMKQEPITGGGFLSFNKEEGRYIGALELSIKKKIAIKAIGILTTKLPGGQPGYSLLLLITAEFQPIQLGFGFTLNGVGGLIALHRRMNTQALRDGVRNGTIDNILFPTDPVANINSIVSSLETVFPIQEGRYSFGPMAIIGWGTPTLITAELGLFFELPDVNEIALIGVIRALLPKEDKPLLKLQIAFAGIINFEKKTITFDATIFDSSLVGLALSGDMVFRLRWGDQPTFVLSVGGFHPKFPIPPLNIPNVRRLTINLLDGDNPRLTLSTYFAITSNTAQFGSAIDFYWAINDNIKVLGHLGYDALFYFNPFRFQATIDGNLDLKYNGKALFSLWFAGLLEGPAPWHVQGSVGFEILGIDYAENFNTTWGGSDYTTLPNEKVLDKLKAALQDNRNWQATMSNDVPLLVTVRELNTPLGDIVVHPQGTIAVSQKVVPLNVDITRFGNARPDPTGYSYFSIDLAYGGQSNLPKTDLREYFAANEFFDLSEGDRLNRPSFETFIAGAKVTSSSTELTTGGYRERIYEYDTTVMDSRRRPFKLVAKQNIGVALRTAGSAGNAAANSPLNIIARTRSANGPAHVDVPGRSYALAQTSDLSSYGISASSYTEALALLEQQIELNPALEGTLQIVNAFELQP